MTNFMTEACVDKKLEPIEAEVDALKKAPILSATRCDGSKIEKNAKLPLCEDLAEVDDRLSKEIDAVENNITTIRTDILVIKTDVVDIKTEILEIEQDIIVIKQDVADLDTRVTTIEANPVLTLVGCDSAPFPVGTKLPTCDQMTAADSALDARLDTIEAKSVLSAVGCSGAALPENAKLVQCGELTTALQAVAENLVDCKNVPIADNTAMVTCENLGETLRALPCEILSNQAGQLLQCRADGIYYGIAPPADVANQFVDAINGNDANSGTRGAPLKTFAEAYRRVPSSSEGCSIYLLESQTHDVGYLGTLKATMNVYTYGPQTDAISAQYNSVPQGWPHYQTESSFAIAATLRSTCTRKVYDGGYGATIFDVPATQSLLLHGLKLAADYGGKVVTSATHIRALFQLYGGLNMLDTTVLNANASGLMWVVASGVGGTISTSHIKLSVETPFIAWLMPFLKLNGVLNGSDSSTPAVIDPQGSGLMIAAFTGTTVLEANVSGAVAPKPQSPNFPTNL